MKIFIGGAGILAPVLCADLLCIYNIGGGPYGVCTNPEHDKNKRLEPVYASTCQHRQHPPVVKDDGYKTDSGLLEEE